MEKNYTYDMLANINILSNIKNETIKEMTGKSFFRIYKKEEILFIEGENNQNIYLICKGKAIVSKSTPEGEEKIIYILQKGDFINEMSIDDRSTSVTVSMIEDSKILCFLKKDVLKWMKEDFDFNMLILNSLSNKLRKSFRQIRNLGLKKTNARICSKLWKLCRDYGEKKENNIYIDLNLTHTQLASMVGTSRESINRFLKQLEREEIIKQKNQKIIILDFEKLERYMKEIP